MRIKSIIIMETAIGIFCKILIDNQIPQYKEIKRQDKGKLFGRDRRQKCQSSNA